MLATIVLGTMAAILLVQLVVNPMLLQKDNFDDSFDEE